MNEITFEIEHDDQFFRITGKCQTSRGLFKVCLIITNSAYEPYMNNFMKDKLRNELIFKLRRLNLPDFSYVDYAHVDYSASMPSTSSSEHVHNWKSIGF